MYFVCLIFKNFIQNQTTYDMYLYGINSFEMFLHSIISSSLYSNHARQCKISFVAPVCYEYKLRKAKHFDIKNKYSGISWLY